MPTSTPSLSSLPKDKPLIFTNLLRFHTHSQYPSSLPPDLQPHITTLPEPTSGSEVYWTRYFPIYHHVAREVLGEKADELQKVIYKGAPLVPLQFARDGKFSSRVESETKSEVETEPKVESEVEASSEAGVEAEESTETTTQRTDQSYWHAVVMTRITSWDVSAKISESEVYKTLCRFHRDAAVEDDELFVSCAVEGFEF